MEMKLVRVPVEKGFLLAFFVTVCRRSKRIEQKHLLLRETLGATRGRARRYSGPVRHASGPQPRPVLGV